MDVKKDKHESTKYTCEAENSMNSGNPLSHKINLKVEGMHGNAHGTCMFDYTVNSFAIGDTLRNWMSTMTNVAIMWHYHCYIGLLTIIPRAGVGYEMIDSQRGV